MTKPRLLCEVRAPRISTGMHSPHMHRCTRPADEAHPADMHVCGLCSEPFAVLPPDEPEGNPDAAHPTSVDVAAARMWWRQHALAMVAEINDHVTSVVSQFVDSVLNAMIGPVPKTAESVSNEINTRLVTTPQETEDLGSTGQPAPPDVPSAILGMPVDVDPTIPPDTFELRDSDTGEVLAKAVDVGPAERDLAAWLDYRGLPPTASIRDLIEHERDNARLAAGFELLREPGNVHVGDYPPALIGNIGNMLRWHHDADVQEIGRRMLVAAGIDAEPILVTPAGLGRGLSSKYIVRRRDGRDQAGGDKANARYFVLDYGNDMIARRALLHYAQLCHRLYPELSDDLLSELATTDPEADE